MKLAQPICKHSQMALVDWVWKPRYSTQDFLVDCGRIKWQKAAIAKVRFSKVNETDEWAGDWLIDKKSISKCRKFDNHGRACYVVPLALLSRPRYEHCLHEAW